MILLKRLIFKVFLSCFIIQGSKYYCLLAVYYKFRELPDNLPISGHRNLRFSFPTSVHRVTKTCEYFLFLLFFDMFTMLSF